MKIVEPEENTLAMALKRFAAWKHYREHDAVMAETQELIDGMLLLEAYAALEVRCRQLEAWHAGGRSNVEFTDTGVRICGGHHEKGEACEWQRYTLETAVEPCRIHEYDGAFKCMTHQKTWGAITNGGQPCEGFDEKQWYADRSLRLAPGWYCAKCGHLNESKDMSCFECGGETATQANRGTSNGCSTSTIYG